MKDVDLGEPTSFLDHVYLGCTHRECQTSKDIVENYRTVFESRISARATEKLPCSENMCISSWSYDMEGHAKKCVERYCESQSIIIHVNTNSIAMWETLPNNEDWNCFKTPTLQEIFWI